MIAPEHEGRLRRPAAETSDTKAAASEGRGAPNTVTDTISKVVRAIRAVEAFLRRSWKALLVAGGIGLFLALDYLMLGPPAWRAEMVVGPIVSNPRFGLEGQGSSALGLLNQLNDPTSQQFSRFLLLLRSRTLAERLQERHQALQIIYRGRWDEKNTKWRGPSVLGHAKNGLRAVMGLPYSRDPTIERLQDYLASHVRVEVVPQTNNRRLTFIFRDRAQAVQMLEWCFEEVDGIMREAAAQHVDRQISYLEAQLSSNAVSIAETRTSLGQLLLSAQRSRVLLISGEPYAAEVVAPASAPVLPNYPSLTQALVFGPLFGVALGAIVTLLWPTFRTQWRVSGRRGK